ncbi:MAG: LemA family protein [Pontiellaceae bacterium]|nr:LemA family protein [Pontiellaceae bacterium]MBN2785968.1 LemA family protein [Pontiellaceae bacterium]
MKKGCLISLVAGGVILLLVVSLAGFVGGKYNGFVQMEEQTDQAWANVETVLQRRFDLIPNLVNTVKGYASHEKELLEEVTRLRSQWGEAKAAGNDAQSLQSAGMLESALGRLMVVVENYPELKANQNFMALQEELSGTENRISVERRRYNETVAAYNVSIRKWPGNILAGMMGFERREPFEAAPEAATAPKVEF